jgi:hypothetical protein
MFSHASRLAIQRSGIPAFSATRCWDDIPAFSATRCWDDIPAYVILAGLVQIDCVNALVRHYVQHFVGRQCQTASVRITPHDLMSPQVDGARPASGAGKHQIVD